MKPISYYDGWNDAIECVYQALWHEHRNLAMEVIKLKISWPRIEADERLALTVARRDVARFPARPF
jgi:hypothetical protein